MRYVVVDQNALTNEELIRGLLHRARAGELSLVLTDIALIEATKAHSAEVGLQKSLRYLADYPDGVTCAYGVPELLRLENESQTPRSSVVAEELTPSLRKLIVELQTGRGPRLDYFRSRVEDARKEAAEAHFDGPKNLGRLTRMGDAAVAAFRPELLDAMRQSAMANDETTLHGLLRAALADAQLRQMIGSKLLTEGWSTTVAVGPSVVHNTFLAFTAYALHQKARSWTAEKRATNDLADLDYVVPALLCDGFATLDKLARAIFEDLWSVTRQGPPLAV